MMISLFEPLIPVILGRVWESLFAGAKYFGSMGRGMDLWQLLICRCRKVRSRGECASWVETDVARHLRLPAWWCAPILQLTDFACKRTARVHVDSKIKEVAGVLDLTLIPNKSQELMFEEEMQLVQIFSLILIVEGCDDQQKDGVCSQSSNIYVMGQRRKMPHVGSDASPCRA